MRVDAYSEYCECVGRETETEVVDGVLVRIPDGYPNEAKCPDCRNWYPWFEQEFCCHSCGWVPPAKRWSDE